jgi:hypothetical protein
MEINCPYCQCPVPEDQVNATFGVATCKSCNKSFHPPKKLLKATVDQAKGILVQREEGGILITRDWRSTSPLARPLLAVFLWISFLFILPLPALDFHSPLIAITLAFNLLGLWFSVHVAYLIFNKSFIRVSRSCLEITHGPLPWKKLTLERDNLDQLFVEKREHKGQRKGLPIIKYLLWARLKNGKKRLLMSALFSYEQARKLEQEIEKHLKIEDAPVGGEYRKV